MASQPRTATALAASPVPRSREVRANSRVTLVCADQVVATVSAVEATAATAVAPVTRRVSGASRRCGTASGPVRGARGSAAGRVPAAGSPPCSRRRRTTSATVVAADAATAVPISTLAYRPPTGRHRVEQARRDERGDQAADAHGQAGDRVGQLVVTGP